MPHLHLGVNIDHVATLRQVRLGTQPSLTEAALEAVRGGADSITVHLREDRRHIQDADLPALMKVLRVPLNLEMALEPEIVEIALKLNPEKVCLVPEKRLELTTEGGLNVRTYAPRLRKLVPRFLKKNIEVSLFIDPDEEQIRTAARLLAGAIELHTGAYAEARGKKKQAELARIRRGSVLGEQLGIKVHAGHGLDYENVGAVAAIPQIRELNIGHSIVARAVFAGMRTAVREMKSRMRKARR